MAISIQHNLSALNINRQFGMVMGKTAKSSENSVKAANDTNQSEDRTAIQSEIDALFDENDYVFEK